MELTNHDYIEAIKNIETQVSALGDYLYCDRDPHANKSIERIEAALASLRNTFYDDHTYVKLTDRETGETEYRYFEKGDMSGVCYLAAKIYNWSDCDDTYRIDKIVCDGVELEYTGWQPGMVFEFREVESEKIVWSMCKPEWDH